MVVRSRLLRCRWSRQRCSGMVGIHGVILVSRSMSDRPELDELLRPSLTAGAAGETAAIYSPTALFLSAFFAGPFAAIAVASLNARRSGRTRRDLPYLSLALAASVVLLVVLFRPGADWSVADLSPERSARLFWRAFALLLALCVYLLHRRNYRTMAMVGMDPPKPWPQVILCCVLGVMLQVAIVTVLRL
jgi:hypothetical protein